METKRFDEAERELLVAVSQSPRHIAAHELLAKLYRDYLNRPADVFAHEGRARSLRHEILALKRGDSKSGRKPSKDENPNGIPASRPGSRHVSNVVSANSFSPEIDPSQIITIVSGLPRSGTLAHDATSRRRRT